MVGIFLEPFKLYIVKIKTPWLTNIDLCTVGRHLRFTENKTPEAVVMYNIEHSLVSI